MVNTRKLVILAALLLINPALSGASAQTQTFDVNIPQEAEKSGRKKRMRKSSKIKKEKNETKKIRTYMDMEYEQLVKAKDAQKASGNLPSTIKYLEQLLKLTTDITQVATHLLELADTLFEDKQFTKSAFVYNQYCALYPGSEKQEYALYKSIMSSFACILSIDRDQSKTEETLALTELFLKQDLFKAYREEVMQVQKQCYEHLAASECSICTFYLNKGSLKAAEKRLKNLRTSLLPKLPTLEPEIIALEAQMTDQKTMLELLNNKNTAVAQNSKKHMANRF